MKYDNGNMTGDDEAFSSLAVYALTGVGLRQGTWSQQEESKRERKKAKQRHQCGLTRQSVSGWRCTDK